MIAETATWVVLTQSAWMRVTAPIPSDGLRRAEPYSSAETVFQGRCVEVRETLGL